MTDYVALTREFYALLLNDFEAAVSKFVADDFVWENPLPEVGCSSSRARTTLACRRWNFSITW